MTKGLADQANVSAQFAIRVFLDVTRKVVDGAPEPAAGRLPRGSAMTGRTTLRGMVTG